MFTAQEYSTPTLLVPALTLAPRGPEPRRTIRRRFATLLARDAAFGAKMGALRQRCAALDQWEVGGSR